LDREATELLVWLHKKALMISTLAKFLRRTS